MVFRQINVLPFRNSQWKIYKSYDFGIVSSDKTAYVIELGYHLSKNKSVPRVSGMVYNNTFGEERRLSI